MNKNRVRNRLAQHGEVENDEANWNKKMLRALIAWQYCVKRLENAATLEVSIGHDHAIFPKAQFIPIGIHKAEKDTIL